MSQSVTNEPKLFNQPASSATRLESHLYTHAMRLATNAHVEWVDDEAVVLDQETGQLHYLNRSAAVILALVLEHDRNALGKLIDLHGDNADIREEFHRVVEEMVDKDLLEDA